MSATVSFQQKKMIHRLLKTGRWNNASEIIRYGLELVRREVEQEDLRPYPDSVLAGVYKQFSQEDRRQDSELGRASALPEIGELD